jgi:hypothetical protein
VSFEDGPVNDEEEEGSGEEEGPEVTAAERIGRKKSMIDQADLL